jgi:hypothetical protein
LLEINDDINEIINDLYGSTLNGFWDFKRKMVEDGYKDVVLPLHEIDSPTYQMSTEWNIEHLIGYLNTWSAVKKYTQTFSINPVEKIINPLLEAWGNPEALLVVTWPLNVRIWKGGNQFVM